MKHFSELSPTAERVVDAAEGLIQQHGYNGFSYDSVAQLVGIKKPSIHHHFATKAELVAVVAQRYTHRFREQLLAIDGRCAKAPDKLAAYVELFARTYADDRRLCVCGMLGAEGGNLPEEAASEVANFFTVNLVWLREVMAAGQRAGLLRAPSDPQAQANLFLSSLEGAMVLGRGARQDGGPAAAGATLISHLLA